MCAVLLASTFLKILVLLDMNSGKVYSIVCQQLFENASIA